MQIDLPGIVALLLSAVALWKAWRLAPKEVAGADADASSKYATASSLTAQQNEKLILRIDELTKKIDEYDSKVSILEDESILAKGKIVALEHKVVNSDLKVVTLQNQVERMGRMLKRRDVLIIDWQNGINVLLGQMCDADITPNWTPSVLLDKIDDEDQDIIK